MFPLQEQNPQRTTRKGKPVGVDEVSDWVETEPLSSKATNTENHDTFNYSVMFSPQNKFGLYVLLLPFWEPVQS